MSLFEIKKDIEVIPNFVNLEKYNSTTSKTNLLNNNHKIITHVSNFRKVKRIIDVIDVFDGIQKEIPAKLLMIGDGPKKIRQRKKQRD